MTRAAPSIATDRNPPMSERVASEDLAMSRGRPTARRAFAAGGRGVRGRRRAHPLALALPALVALLLAAGCATPVGVERADPQSVHRELTGNVLSTGELSDFTENLLRAGGVAELAAE